MQGEKVGSIYYDLDLDDDKFKRGLIGARTAGQEFGNQLERLGRTVVNFGKMLAAAGVIAIGVGAFIGVKFNAQLETARQGFITLLGSAEKANKAIEMIKKDAAKTPFEFQGLVQANQLLTAVTKDAEVSERLLLNVGKALSAMGKGQPELDRIVVNLQQIGATGRATLMDVRQFAFAGIPIFEMLAQATGKTGVALEKFISEGNVSFELLTKMFNQAGEAGGRFEKAFINQAGTLAQLFSNLKDTANIELGFIFEPLFNSSKKGIGAILDFTNSPAWAQLRQVAQDSVGKIAAFLDQISTKIASGDFQGALDLLKAKFATMFDGIDWVVIGNKIINGLVTALSAIPWATYAYTLTNGFLTMLLNMDWAAIITLIVKMTPKIITAFIKGLIDAAISNPLDFLMFFLALGFLPGKVLTAITAALSKIPLIGPIFAWIFGAIGSVAQMMLGPIRTWFANVGRTVVSSVISGVRGLAGSLLGPVRGMIDDALGVVRGFAGRFVDAGWALIRALANGIRGAAGEVYNAAKAVVQKVRDLLPFSDAKEGPLSNLTMSGKKFSQTFAAGMLQGAGAIERAGMLAMRSAMPGALNGGQGDTSVNTQFFAPINIGSQQDADYLLEKISYDDKLTSMGLSPSL